MTFTKLIDEHIDRRSDFARIEIIERFANCLNVGRKLLGSSILQPPDLQGLGR